MKSILTSDIQLNVSRQPFSKTSIEWINEANQELHPLIATVHGLNQSALTEIYDGTINNERKYVFVDGVFYRVPAPGDANQDATIADPLTNGRYLIAEGFAASDPVTMTNGDQENVHSDKYIYIADVAKVGGGDKFDIGNELKYNNVLFTNDTSPTMALTGCTTSNEEFTVYKLANESTKIFFSFTVTMTADTAEVKFDNLAQVLHDAGLASLMVFKHNIAANDSDLTKCLLKNSTSTISSGASAYNFAFELEKTQGATVSNLEINTVFVL